MAFEYLICSPFNTCSAQFDLSSANAKLQKRTAVHLVNLLAQDSLSETCRRRSGCLEWRSFFFALSIWNHRPLLYDYHALPFEGSELRQEITWSGWWSGPINFFVFMFFGDVIKSFSNCSAHRCINWNVGSRDISWAITSPQLNDSAIVGIRNALLFRLLRRQFMKNFQNI